MLEAYFKTFPIIAIFLLGFFLKRLKVFKPDDGGVLLKLLFFIVSPALIYLATSSLEITPKLLSFPLIAATTMFTIYFFNLFATKYFNVPRKTLGVYMIGTLIANTGFTLPFLLATHGLGAAARVAMWDLTGGFLTFVFVYSLAVKYGDKRPSNKFIVQKILISPPVWALFTGLLVNFANFQTPEIVLSVFKNISSAYTPLIMLALGFYFDLKISLPKHVVAGLLTRMLGGFIIGLSLSYVFKLDAQDRLITIICASAPIGFNTLTFSKMEKLDTQFAASLVSGGILVGLFLVPLLTAF